MRAGRVSFWNNTRNDLIPPTYNLLDRMNYEVIERPEHESSDDPDDVTRAVGSMANGGGSLIEPWTS